LRLFSRPYRRSPAIASLTAGRVEIQGRVEALEELVSPLTGERAVAMHYRASTPSAVGAFGELPGNALRLAVSGSQGRDFVLRDESGAALIRVARGRDIEKLHADLVDRHGLGLRAEASLIESGQRVLVRGQVVEVFSDSPHRRVPYGAVLEAESVHAIG
jgi:hypothetical protein